MNWRWKARVQNLIAALPWSDAVYYAVQRGAGGLRPGRHDPREWLRAAVRMFDWIEQSGREAAGRSFLEVGTGRALDLPLGLWLCGARRVTTVDLNPYLAPAIVRESVEFLRRGEREVTEIFGRRAEGTPFRERFRRLAGFAGDTSELLRLTGIEYAAPADAARLKLADGSVDYHVSYTVLEHIPPDALAAILAEARRVVAPGGLLLHVVDPSDHFAHEDESLTAVNFLQFSEREWARIAGNKFMYHNRLRAHEYVELFERAGVRLLRQRQSVDEASLRLLRDGFRLDARFAGTDAEELAVSGITLMGSFDAVN